jgi:hypothetical protein
MLGNFEGFNQCHVWGGVHHPARREHIAMVCQSSTQWKPASGIAIRNLCAALQLVFTTKWNVSDTHPTRSTGTPVDRAVDRPAHPTRKTIPTPARASSAQRKRRRTRRVTFACPGPQPANGTAISTCAALQLVCST